MARRNGTERNDPSVPVMPLEELSQRHRLPRETGGIRVSATTVKAVAVAVAFAGIIWGAAVFANGKANASDVGDIDRRVQKVETSVEVIKTEQREIRDTQKEMQREQRMLIRALGVRPDSAGRDN